MRRQGLERKSKALGTAKTAFAVNPDFGYLHSQVLDKDAFRHYLNAPAGPETQDELQELSRLHSPAGYMSQGGAVGPKVETKPILIKLEKENHPPTLTTSYTTPSSNKRPRVDEPEEDRAVKLEPYHGLDIVASSNENLRISVLEAELASLRSQVLVNQQAMERKIQELQQNWQTVRQDCGECQAWVRGLRVRMDRVEGHVDEIVAHLPAHHGWKSEVGSDYDPDVTLAQLEMGHGSQPEWTQSQWEDWSNEWNAETKNGVCL
ncbi:hypothetical protein C8R45DRAFT_943014 [Mycena sanguinolenta]|nr:hypothetical protein C8R45DRAFT_943014 [Mycena sanguinolenta]